MGLSKAEKVKQFGEVFTPGWCVRDMCDMLEAESPGCFEPETTFLEPACGDGAFVAEILRRKFERCKCRRDLSYDKAREWAEAHLSAEAYGEIFGMPGEDAGDAALNIQIDAGLMAKLRARAAEDGASLTATVAALLEKGLEK